MRRHRLGENEQSEQTKNNKEKGSDSAPSERALFGWFARRREESKWLTLYPREHRYRCDCGRRASRGFSEKAARNLQHNWAILLGKKEIRAVWGIAQHSRWMADDRTEFTLNEFQLVNLQLVFWRKSANCKTQKTTNAKQFRRKQFGAFI